MHWGGTHIRDYSSDFTLGISHGRRFLVDYCKAGDGGLGGETIQELRDKILFRCKGTDRRESVELGVVDGALEVGTRVFSGLEVGESPGLTARSFTPTSNGVNFAASSDKSRRGKQKSAGAMAGWWRKHEGLT